MSEALIYVRHMTRIVREETRTTIRETVIIDVGVSFVRNEVVLLVCIMELNELDPAFGAYTLARPPISIPKSKNSQ